MDLSKCRDACGEANTLCVQAATHYLVKGDEKLRDVVRLLWDCSDICEAAVRFLNRGSPNHREICRACAIICSRCADACGKIADPVMARCAESCRICAGLCLELTGH
ncbi:four-helix bundle copper-binding protein [Shumkonia mesophila]|uniref:four-helix bundle copper-binding protein n=1 Tax=Shumkonia mesophila TaxID=2838854 RepID=UPI002934136F|nr:four-helix bundle copper-binding protein [Shumkonia mesophila]